MSYFLIICIVVVTFITTVPKELVDIIVIIYHYQCYHLNFFEKHLILWNLLCTYHLNHSVCSYYLNHHLSMLSLKPMLHAYATMRSLFCSSYQNFTKWFVLTSARKIITTTATTTTTTTTTTTIIIIIKC